jgi:Integral membrane protein, interacts with FtsH
MNISQNTATQTRSRVEITNAFLRSVYRWMATGLALTAVVSLFVASSPAALTFIFGNQLVFFGLIIGQLGMVFYLSARISKLSAEAATGLFLVYSALNGATLASIFIVYEIGSIMQAFFTAAGMFAAISIYGSVTKRDLTGVGSFCMMGLFGIIIAAIVNIFLGSDQLAFGISIVGVIVFVGLTAYDTQKLKMMGESLPHNDALAVRRGTILGALTLYLDFINLFLMLLRLFGDRR